MRIARFAVVVAFLILPSLLAASDSTVTIPLTDFEKIREGEAAVSAVVIDTLELGGSFRDAKLSIAFSGRSIGTRAAVRVLDGAAALTISGCSGDALITRAAQGAFDLIPLAPSFRARCDLRVSGSDRLQLHAPPSILSVRSSVSDGELLAGDEDEHGGRAWTLVRQASTTSETLSVTATGRYLVTFLPDATRFRYLIDVHNPNRSTASLPLRLSSGEHVQEIKSPSAYDVRDGSYLFSIAPGDSAIVLTGELRGDSFAVPLDATLQYLVIENHPLLRPTATGAAKRVSVAETGVTATYRGAQAFELTGKERVTWRIARLEALHTISYAVNGATHSFFLGTDGDIPGESTFAINNQGAANILLPQKPKPTYAALGAEPLLMTAAKDGRVNVPLSAGEQKLFIQHMQSFRSFAGIGFASFDVPRLPVASSGTIVYVGYPRQWTPLIETFASRAKIASPDLTTLLFMIVLFAWTERLLVRLGIAAKRRLALALLIAITAMTADLLFYIVVLASAVMTFVFLSPLPPHRWDRARFTFATLVVVVTVGMIAWPTLQARRELEQEMAMYTTGSGGLGSVSQPVTDQLRTIFDEQKQAGVNAFVNSPDTSTKADAYQGLPARFAMPQADRQTLFGVPLLSAKHPQQVVSVMISGALLWWLRVALVALVAWMSWRERHTIAAAIQARMTTSVAPAVPEVGLS